jgi:hypothetical protein
MALIQPQSMRWEVHQLTDGTTTTTRRLADAEHWHRQMQMTTTDDYARAIIAEGQTARTVGADHLLHPVITERGIEIALATVFVETNFVMYANNPDPESLNFPHDAIGSDFDSDGLFQQRAQFFGTVAERMDAALSAAMFYHLLAAFPYNDPNTPPGTFAQDVQRSAFPDRYDERFSDAVDLYNRLVGTGTGDDTPPVGGAGADVMTLYYPDVSNRNWGSVQDLYNFLGQLKAQGFAGTPATRRRAKRPRLPVTPGTYGERLASHSACITSKATISSCGVSGSSSR